MGEPRKRVGWDGSDLHANLHGELRGHGTQNAYNTGVSKVRWVFSRLTASFVLMAWIITPDTICLLPGVHLSESEHECCRHMKGDCGNQAMPASHTCCKSITAPVGALAVKQAKTSIDEMATAIEFSAIPETFALTLNPLLSPLIPANSSPPYSPAPFPAILRI